MKNKGFSVVEFLFAIVIAIAITLVVTYFGRNIFLHTSTIQANLNAQLESRKILNKMVGELRSAAPSALGGYAVEAVATSSITFYSDVNQDDNTDRVRYFLDFPTGVIKRGVVLAAGLPPSYNLGNETITTLMSSLIATSSPIFDYFDKNYAGTSSPLTHPMNIANIRLIRMTVRIDKDPNRAPGAITFISSASLRNLKDNL